jgi:hypothetical protein
MSNVYLLTSLIDACSLSDNITLFGKTESTSQDDAEPPITYYLFDANKTSNADTIKQKNVPSYLISSQHYESFDAKLTYMYNTIMTNTSKMQQSTSISISITTLVSDVQYVDAAVEVVYGLLARENGSIMSTKPLGSTIINTNSTNSDCGKETPFIQQSALCSVILVLLLLLLLLLLQQQQQQLVLIIILIILILLPPLSDETIKVLVPETG